MTFRQFTDSWRFWMLCVALLLTRGYFYHWDWVTWCLLGFFVITTIVRIIARRRNKTEGSQ